MNRRNYLLYMFIISISLLLAVSILVAFYMSRSTSRVEEIARTQRYNVVNAAANFVTADELDQFHAIEDMYSPEYYQIKYDLITFTREYGFNYIYYLRYHPNTDTLQYIGGNSVGEYDMDVFTLDYEDWNSALTNMLNNENERSSVMGFHIPRISVPEDARNAINGQIDICDTGGFKMDDHYLQTAWAPIYYEDGSPSNYVANIAIEEDYLQTEQRKSRSNIILFMFSIVGALASCIFILKLYNDKVNSYKEANQAKSDFLSKISHEIRTPMNAIIGMTKIAEKSNNKDKLRYCLTTIESSSSQLLQLVNDVLDISKIETGHFELENKVENIEKIVMKTCVLFIEQMESKKITLNVVFDPMMRMHYHTDALRLTQVLTNLLSNALKFTPEGGKITLTVDTVLIEGEMTTLRFCVKDNGIGMTKEQSKRIFHKYEQAESSTTKKYGGTGLGLVICKSIVEKMDGNIWIESELGMGSSFIFDVKLKRAPIEVEKLFSNTYSPDDVNFLVVAHEDQLRDHLLGIMNSFGVKPDVSKTSAECIDAATKARDTSDPYDVIIIDYDMPNMNGIDTIKALDKVVNTNTVIIMATFGAWSEITDKASSIGITNFIMKPCFPSSVFDAINEAVHKVQKKVKFTKAESNERGSLENIKILLAEDIEINQIIFTSLLAESKAQIDIANNGRIALEMYEDKEKDYDIIIMDIQMPEMDGLEATRRIRASSRDNAKIIPIVAMTANAFKEDVENCLAAGMNDHLAKPIDEKLLISKIIEYTSNNIIEA